MGSATKPKGTKKRKVAPATASPAPPVESGAAAPVSAAAAAAQAKKLLHCLVGMTASRPGSVKSVGTLRVLEKVYEHATFFDRGMVQLATVYLRSAGIASEDDLENRTVFKLADSDDVEVAIGAEAQLDNFTNALDVMMAAMTEDTAPTKGTNEEQVTDYDVDGANDEVDKHFNELADADKKAKKARTSGEIDETDERLPHPRHLQHDKALTERAKALVDDPEGERGEPTAPMRSSFPTPLLQPAAPDTGALGLGFESGARNQRRLQLEEHGDGRGTLHVSAAKRVEYHEWVAHAMRLFSSLTMAEVDKRSVPSAEVSALRVFASPDEWREYVVFMSDLYAQDPTRWARLVEFDQSLRDKFRREGQGSFAPAAVTHLWQMFRDRTEARPTPHRPAGGPRPKNPKGGHGSGSCHNFNSAAGCSRTSCRFEHKCGKCGKKGHNSLACRG